MKVELSINSNAKGKLWEVQKQETINRARALKEMCSKLSTKGCKDCPFFICRMDVCMLTDDNFPKDWELDEVCEDE